MVSFEGIENFESNRHFHNPPKSYKKDGEVKVVNQSGKKLSARQMTYLSPQSSYSSISWQLPTDMATTLSEKAWIATSFLMMEEITVLTSR